jgi:hypothetical protein
MYVMPMRTKARSIGPHMSAAFVAVEKEPYQAFQYGRGWPSFCSRIFPASKELFDREWKRSEAEELEARPQ